MGLNFLAAMQCPIARSLDRVGELWNIIILRDSSRGLTRRFKQFRDSLGIVPNILSRRPHGLVEAGLPEQSCYSNHPPRAAYLRAEPGRDFRAVRWALIVWGNKLFVPEGQTVVLSGSAAPRQAGPTAKDWHGWPDEAVFLAALHNTEARSQQ